MANLNNNNKRLCKIRSKQLPATSHVGWDVVWMGQNNNCIVILN